MDRADPDPAGGHLPDREPIMSSLHRGDRHLHHADGSHRWSGGPPDQRGRDAYLAALREHLQLHRAAFAAPRTRPDQTHPDPATWLGR